jgi:hypothetical protein
MENQNRVVIIKREQLDLFTKKLKLSCKETSELFDQYRVWEFIDDAFEGIHVQSPLATYEDITGYIQKSGGSI